MEETQTEETTTRRSSSYPPWLDLPDPLTELILERLPLLYYLRFAAVCRKWRSVQKAHRLRYSPSPPPMAPSLPCLVVTDLHQHSSTPNCYSPFDQTLRRLRLPSTLLAPKFITSAHGWLLLLHKRTCASSLRTLSLLNPVTGAHILLPPLVAYPGSSPYGAISAPPSDPHFSILIKVAHNFFLYRHGADRSRWTKLDSPLGSIFSYYNFVFHCADKFYCVSKTLELYVIDPFLLEPPIQLLEMDTSQLLPYGVNDVFRFQEVNGEISVLVRASDPDYGFDGFLLFKADLLTNVWMRMEGMGDRVLFAADRSLFSLLSADVGCNDNCIYFLQDEGVVWFSAKNRPHHWEMFEIFNLETMSFVSEQPIPDSTTKKVLLQWERCHLQWFLPSL